MATPQSGKVGVLARCLLESDFRPDEERVCCLLLIKSANVTVQHQNNPGSVLGVEFDVSAHPLHYACGHSAILSLAGILTLENTSLSVDTRHILV